MFEGCGLPRYWREREREREKERERERERDREEGREVEKERDVLYMEYHTGFTRLF